MFQEASKRRIVGSLGVLCQRMSDDVIQQFADHSLTDPFHRLSVDDDIDESNMLLCEAVFSGLSEVVQLPRDSVSETVRSLLTGNTLITIYQLLPAPHPVCLTPSAHRACTMMATNHDGHKVYHDGCIP